MKNCVSGGRSMNTPARKSIKQPSEARIRKLMAKKAKKAKHGQHK